ncbi:MAG: F0F1 ATP synthase subunit gamma [Actinobacteria bacterium]|nr:F0F1 ATP synthase subunit gamma [Actinomycetota bacterium]
MAQQLRDVKRRIGSVESTQKITRAMELISSSRIIKAQQRVEAARPYAETMRRLLVSVATNASNVEHPLLQQRDEVNKVGHIVVSSDRGLAGAYNSNVIRTAERDMQAEGADVRLFLTGKKAVSYFRFRGYDTDESWTGFSDKPGIEDARNVASAAAKAFSDGEVDQVKLTYTRFESSAVQRPHLTQVLPLTEEELEAAEEDDAGKGAQYEFEPSPEEILDYLLPRYLESTVYQALLEAAASEHAARRRAMKAASDNAEELIEDLTRDYNQARQAEITTEIMEVVGGAEALAGNASDGPS